MNRYSQWMFHENQLIPNNRPNPMIHEAEPPNNADLEKRIVYANINRIGRLLTNLYPTGSFTVDIKGTLTGLRYRIGYYHLHINKEQLRLVLHNIGFEIVKDYGGVLHLINENRQ